MTVLSETNRWKWIHNHWLQWHLSGSWPKMRRQILFQNLNFIFSSVRRGLDLGTGGWRFKSHTKSCQSTTWALPMCPRARHWTSNCLDHRIGWSDKHGLNRGVGDGRGLVAMVSQTWTLKWITFVHEVSCVIRKKKNNDPVSFSIIDEFYFILFINAMPIKPVCATQMFYY